MPLIISTGAQRAAKLSRVQVAGQNLAMASWEATAQGADLPTVNFESYNLTTGETYAEGLYGVLSCDGRFGGAWDAGGGGAGGSKFTANPPGLYVRDDLGASGGSTKLFISRAGFDGTHWEFPYMRIRGVNNSAAVEGLVLFNVSDFKNQGRFGYP